jgi:hypothetical protein
MVYEAKKKNFLSDFTNFLSEVYKLLVTADLRVQEVQHFF